jgi:hypothetical protein
MDKFQRSNMEIVTLFAVYTVMYHDLTFANTVDLKYS